MLGASGPRRESSEDGPRALAERAEENADLVGVGRHALQIGERARRSLSGIEQADNRTHVGLVESGKEPGLVEAPVPVLRRRGEEQQEHVAARQRTADLAPPVHTRGDVDVGDEAVDHLPIEAFDGVLHFDRQRMVIVLVADEHRELVIADSHGLPPAWVDGLLKLPRPLTRKRPEFGADHSTYPSALSRCASPASASRRTSGPGGRRGVRPIRSLSGAHQIGRRTVSRRLRLGLPRIVREVVGHRLPVLPGLVVHQHRPLPS